MEDITNTLNALRSFELVASQPPQTLPTAISHQEQSSSAESQLSSSSLQPLHHLLKKWTIWFVPFNYRTSFDNKLTKLGTFSSVEGYWALVRAIPSPTQMLGDIFIFRDGIRPRWDDHQNEKGGQWSFKCKTTRSYQQLWEKLQLNLIGGEFEECEKLNGIVLAVREHEAIISIWHGDSTNQVEKYRIRDIVSNIWGIDLEMADMLFVYKLHSNRIKWKMSFDEK